MNNPVKYYFFLFFMFLTYISFSQNLWEQPEHYKTLDSKDLKVGDTIVVDYRFGFCDWHSISFNDSIYHNTGIFILFEDKKQLIFDIHNHTDTRGSSGANLKLSQTRVENIKKRLIEYGLDSSQFRHTKGFGEDYPLIKTEIINELESEHEQERAHQMNRRTYFIIVGKKEK